MTTSHGITTDVRIGITRDDYAAMGTAWDGGTWAGLAAMGSEVDSAHRYILESVARGLGCAWCGEAILPTDTVERAHIFPIVPTVRRKFVPRVGCAVVHTGCNRADKSQVDGIVRFDSIVRPDWVLASVPSDTDMVNEFRVARREREATQRRRNAARGL